MKRRVLCDWLGWHRPGPIVIVPGGLVQGYAVCRRCQHVGMIDSQGNLF